MTISKFIYFLHDTAAFFATSDLKETI